MGVFWVLGCSCIYFDILWGKGGERNGGLEAWGCNSLVARVVAILDVGSGFSTYLTTHFYIQAMRYKNVTAYLSELIIIPSTLIIILPPQASHHP